MHSYDEVFQASVEYFGGDELAAKVFVDKYSLKDGNGSFLEKTPDATHRRLAKEFARIEQTKFKTPYTEEYIFSLFKNFSTLIPQGSPIFGIGNNHQNVSISNCFVIDGPEDSYGSLLKADQEIVQISKRRGGVGVDLSKPRPTRTKTHNSSNTSTGTTSWMKRYSNSIREVGQDGRRGALMESISVHHPDILEFATIKNDDKEVTGANISVRLSDEFLNAVINKTTYEQRWKPIAGSTIPPISKQVDAKSVWDTIIHSAWLRAEPGLLFWDNIIRESPADCYETYGFRTICTNPCLSLNTKLLTKNGIRNLADVNIGDKIWSKDGWTSVINKWKTGTKEVFCYRTTSSAFYGTNNHRVVCNNVKSIISDVDSIDFLRGVDISDNIIHNPQDIMDGLILGDGTWHKASNNLILLQIGTKDQDYFNSEVAPLIFESAVKPDLFKINTTIKIEELDYTYNRTIPNRFVFGDNNKVCSFLRGLYSANGSICDTRITLKAASFDVIESVQLMLNSIGIASYYTTNKAKNIKFSNGEYICKESYDLNITRDKYKFKKYIGFIQKDKTDKLDSLLSSNNKCDRPEILNRDIISTEFIGIEDVFDITVDNNSHTFWTQGCNVSNCGEIPLSAYDSCRLFAINLMAFIKNPFTKNAYFDFSAFYELAQVAQRLMDDMVDLEVECIDKILAKIDKDPEDEEVKSTEKSLWNKIRHACVTGRRTGLGITALGDTIAALGIGYGTDESIQIVDKIYKTLKFGSYRSSVDMAKELGAFPCWDWELEKENPFINRIKDETIGWNVKIRDSYDIIEAYQGKDLWNDIKKYGRRNIANLTTAPTGTISMLASFIVDGVYYFNTSFGIEPATFISYNRSKKGNASDKSFRVDYTDKSGDTWMVFPVFHAGVLAWHSLNKDKAITESPYHGFSSNDIDWLQRVKLQAQAQKHVDHAISSTINLPKDVKEEMVAEIYLTAWQAGCKGVTVYRDGCRTGVINSTEKTADATKRPKSLPCDVHHVTVRGKGYFVLVGIRDDKPYEVFAGKNGFLDHKIKHGKINKVKKGYKAVFDDETELTPITSMCDDHEEAITRLVSTGLRFGADINTIVEQLEKVNGDISCFAKSISRALKKYIRDGEETSEKCQECSATLVRSEGCKKCNNCGWSKC